MTIESLARELQGAVSRACANLHQIRPEAHAKVIEEAARPHITKLAAATAQTVAAARERVAAAEGVVDSAARLLGRTESADSAEILARQLRHQEIRAALRAMPKGQVDFVRARVAAGELEILAAAESDPIGGLIDPATASEIRREALALKAPALFDRLEAAREAERQARRAAGEMAAEVGKTIADAIPATHARLRTIGQRVTPHELFSGDQVPEAAGEPLDPVARLKQHRRASSPASDPSDAPAA